MGYIHAIEKAGAKVHANLYSGDYQGTIIAFVTYEGNTGFVTISYGSCSHCDDHSAWREQFGYDNGPTDEDYAIYGRPYLEHIQTYEEIHERYKEQAVWDFQGGEALEWVELVWACWCSPSKSKTLH